MGADQYAKDRDWRGNYIRAQWAGRLMDPEVFPTVVSLMKQAHVAGGARDDRSKASFTQICVDVMPDVPAETRDKLIRDIWAATWASRALGDQVKSCW